MNTSIAATWRGALGRLRRPLKSAPYVLVASAVVGGLLSSTVLSVATPAFAASGPVGPAFGDSGIVRTPLRPSTEDFATSLARQPNGQFVLAAGAGGDFGLSRFDDHLNRGELLGPVDGMVTTDFGGTDDIARAVGVTSSGGVVAAGSAGGDLAIARYEHGGVLDRSFDGDGRLTVDLGGPDDSAYGVTSLADDRIVVVGGDASALSVLRLLPDGQLDLSFGSSGRVTMAASGPARAVSVQPDGKLLVAGGGDRLVVYRLLADGSLDSGFGTAGVATVALVGGAVGNALDLDPDGTVTVAGSRGDDVVVARFTAAGQPETTFGIGGATITSIATPAAAYGVARHDDGVLLVVGDAGDTGLLVQYRPDGSLDAGFGAGGYTTMISNPMGGALATRFRAVLDSHDGGWAVAGAEGSDARVFHVDRAASSPKGATTDFGYGKQLVTSSLVQPDGKVVVIIESGGDVALARYNPDGTLDGGFGSSGIVVSDRLSFPRGVALQPGGRIVVAGSTSSGLARAAILGFGPDGSTDTTFGTDGQSDPAPEESNRSSGLAVLADGRLLLADYACSDCGIHRFTADGRVDTTFGQGGRISGVFTDPGAGPIVVQPDGRFLVLRRGDTVARFNGDGSPDLGFGTGGTLAFTTAPWLFWLRALAVQPDGRILVAGVTFSGAFDTTVFRVLADGSPDPSWVASAAYFKAPAPTGHMDSSPSTLTLLANGGVVVGGLGYGDLGLVRLHSDGTFDGTFGVDGVLSLPVSPDEGPVGVVATAAAGLLVVASEGYGSPAAGVLLARVATGPLGAPTAVTAVAGSGSARVHWTRPPLFDESPINAYRVTASDGVHSATTMDGAHFSAVVTGLTTGQAYTFSVQAIRTGGDGPRSSPSAAVTPGLSSPTLAWGWNGATQLGDATAVDRHAPVATVGISGAIALAGGGYHSIALRADGTVWTWGWNGLGELGDGTRTSRATAVQVPGLSGVVAVAAGMYHSLALKNDGTVWAWGWNGFGQLGTGTRADILLLRPTRVLAVSGITAISAGFHHSLAVRSDGTVLGWGWNSYGQLGDDTTLDSPVAKAVPGLTGITAVAGGGLHSIALGSNGRVWAWGWNGVGQLGMRDLNDRRTPYLVDTQELFVGIAAGAFHNYALRGNGTAASWGWNGYGQLGNGAGVLSSGTMDVNDLDDVVSITAGWFHGLAVRSDGSVVAWGDNSYGQLGDSTTTGRRTPAAVGVPSAVAVGAGAYHSLSG